MDTNEVKLTRTGSIAELINTNSNKSVRFSQIKTTEYDELGSSNETISLLVPDEDPEILIGRYTISHIKLLPQVESLNELILFDDLALYIYSLIKLNRPTSIIQFGSDGTGNSARNILAATDENSKLLIVEANIKLAGPIEIITNCNENVKLIRKVNNQIKPSDLIDYSPINLIIIFLKDVKSTVALLDRIHDQFDIFIQIIVISYKEDGLEFAELISEFLTVNAIMLHDDILIYQLSVIVTN